MLALIQETSSFSLLKFVYVTSQLRHSLVVKPLLRKILDPPLNSHFQKEAMCKPFRPFEWKLIRGWALLNFHYYQQEQQVYFQQSAKM